MIDIKVPPVGESISEVTLVKWLKKDGDYVDRDEVIAELESEKATFEVNAEQAGVLKSVGKEGDTLKIGDVVAQIDDAAAKPGSDNGQSATGNRQPAAESSQEATGNSQPSATNSQEGNKQEATVATQSAAQPNQSETINQKSETSPKATPVASAMIADKKLDPKNIPASGDNGKILKDDVLDMLMNPGKKPGSKSFTRDEKREK